jgi:hypothetical protein
MATYLITPSVTEVDEGGSIVFTIDITAGDATTYGVTIVSGTTTTYVDADDFNPVGGMWYNFTLTNELTSGVYTITNVLSLDAALEGPEFFIAQLRETNTSGAVLAVTQAIVINDTSDGVPPLTIENGRIGTLSTDTGQLLYAFNDVVYKVTGTPISF